LIDWLGFGPFQTAAVASPWCDVSSDSGVTAQVMEGMEKATLQRIYPMAGMFSCEVCKSEKVWHQEAQIMRGDEAMTVFLTCADCGHRFALDRGF
jgi:DNA-directed RNA polymerase subunit M/transcription elongation factor TFIIS